MRQRFARTLVTLVLLSGLFNAAALACGPFSIDAIFVHSVHPNYPLERFAQGEIGIPQPTYARSYLYVVYRHLSGAGFTESEQKELVALWKERLGYDGGGSSGGSVAEWLEARKQFAGLPEIKSIEVYRSREKPNDYDSYLNCQDDSFDTAVTTLKARVGKYGAQDPAVRSWVEAQDTVFANCAEGRRIPADLEPTADALLRADRTYQIAAANFYSTNFDEALKGFEAIRADSKSPWSTIAPYLIARTLLRKASLGPDESRTATLTQAESQFKKVLADKRLTTLHATTERLLNLVRLRLRPAERRAELAQVLLNKKPNEHLKQDLWDYTILLDGVVDSTESQKPKVPGSETDDLTNWLLTFQAEGPEALENSLARWESTKSPLWLMSAISKAEPNHPKSAELITQGLAVNAKSAAFLGTRFHVVRLLAGAGKVAQARTILDEVLTSSRAGMDQSTLNLFIGQKMKLATNLTEFLKNAPRKPAALSWNDDGREIPADEAEIAEEAKTLRGRLLLDMDAANALNVRFPVVVLKEAAQSKVLPEALQRDLVQSTWLRAVMLGDFKTADELVPTLRAQVPALTALLNEYSSATQPDAKLFSAIYAWLKFPGLEPVVDGGIGRETALNEQDSYRDNWWCAFITSEAKNSSAPAFLKPAEVQMAAKESATLSALGPGPNYLCKQTVQWANKNPTDPRAAEALHLAVVSTRYGCTDKETGRWSKAAFDVLHRRYPNSSWAKKTPYWFKE
jgi:hypothetical protein